MPDRQSHPWKTRIANIGMVVFGLIMAVTPLALWVAPTKFWFYFILELFALSGVIVWFLSGFETSAADHQQSQQGKRSTFDRIAGLLRSLVPFKPAARNQHQNLADKELRQLAEKHRKELRDRKND